MKSVSIESFSGPYLEQKISEYGHILRSVNWQFLFL